MTVPCRGTGCSTGMLRDHPALRFDGISRLLPGLKAAKDRCDVGIPVVQKEERRTGARMFVLSGTVCDDPGLFLEVYIRNVRFELAQGNINCTGDVTELI